MEKNKFETYLKEIEPDISAKSFAYRIWGLDKEDVAQELRIHLLNKFDLFNPDKASFRTWANRVMRNKLIDLERTNRKEKDIIYASQFKVEDNEEFDTYEEAIATDGGKYAREMMDILDNQIILDRIEELPERQQQVVKLKVYESWTFKEIAEELGISEKNTYKHWEKAKEVLGERLGDFID